MSRHRVSVSLLRFRAWGLRNQPVAWARQVFLFCRKRRWLRRMLLFADSAQPTGLFYLLDPDVRNLAGAIYGRQRVIDSYGDLFPRDVCREHGRQDIRITGCQIRSQLVTRCRCSPLRGIYTYSSVLLTGHATRPCRRIRRYRHNLSRAPNLFSCVSGPAIRHYGQKCTRHYKTFHRSTSFQFQDKDRHSTATSPGCHSPPQNQARRRHERSSENQQTQTPEPGFLRTCAMFIP